MPRSDKGPTLKASDPDIVADDLTLAIEGIRESLAATNPRYGTGRFSVRHIVAVLGALESARAALRPFARAVRRAEMYGTQAGQYVGAEDWVAADDAFGNHDAGLIPWIYNSDDYVAARAALAPKEKTR